MAGDLKIDTSSEVLGQAVGGMNQNHYPYSLYRSSGLSLTSSVQGMKRPLGPSTLGNQSMPQQQFSFDGYKVSLPVSTLPCLCFCTIVHTAPQTQHA